jgi:hypothetical protein
LEGNFAFASGLQEMLIQSSAGFIEVLPATPASWQNLAFENLRTEGAFLVSLKKADGQVTEIKIVAEKSGKTKLKLPFKTFFASRQKKVQVRPAETGFINLNFKPGAALVLKTDTNSIYRCLWQVPTQNLSELRLNGMIGSLDFDLQPHRLIVYKILYFFLICLI